MWNRFKKACHKATQKAKHLGLAIGAVIGLGAQKVQAAAITLPTGAESDIVANIGVGGALALTAAVAVVGYIVILKMIRRSA
jgi:hypothetical protein